MVSNVGLCTTATQEHQIDCCWHWRLYIYYTFIGHWTLYFQNGTSKYTYSICQNRFNSTSSEEQMVYQEDNVNDYTQIWCKWQQFYIPIQNKLPNGKLVWAFDYQHGQTCANATEPNDCWLYWICDKTATKTQITSIVPAHFCDVKVNITSPYGC